MGYKAFGSKKWKPNKKEAEEFKNKMNEIEQFLYEHGDISASSSRDSFYFQLNGQHYRVSIALKQATQEHMISGRTNRFVKSTTMTSGIRTRSTFTQARHAL